jgi:probable phosphoglycerate mutase
VLAFLIRHGRAQYKPGRLYGWTPGVHLSSDGVEDAKRLAVRLEPVRFRAIYSSPLDRCRETADPIASPRRLDVNVVDELGEVKYGSWQGKTFRSLAKTKLWRTVQLAPSRAVFPGGESIRAMQQRGVDAVETIGRQHRSGAIAIVSHADMIKAIVAHYLGMHLDLFQRVEISPASTTIIALGDFPRVLRVNDIGSYDEFRPAKPKRP